MNRELIYIAGHTGLVGTALMEKGTALGLADWLVTRTHKQLDLTLRTQVDEFFTLHPVKYVFLAAGRVGGIGANMNQPVHFLYENAMIALNVIHACANSGVKKLVYLGSSCIYPRDAAQPILETSILTGALEHTNEAYAIAKIMGVKLCQYYKRDYKKNFVSVMPTNLYGNADHFDVDRGHVIPALLKRFHEAKKKELPYVTLWGTGQALREFLHAEDAADALYLIMDQYNDDYPINLGSGEEVTIYDLAQLVKKVTDYPGEIRWDTSKPDGTPRKRLDLSKMARFGFKPRWTLEEGLRSVYSKVFN
jgi:GDP-L-fucose synthase